MTRMVSIKTQAEIPASLKDLVSLQIVDNNIEAVVVKVGEEYIRITKADAYGNNLKLTKEQGKVEVTRFAVTGKYLGMVEVYEEFEDKWDARAKFDEYVSKAGYAEHGLEVKEIVVLVEPDKIS